MNYKEIIAHCELMNKKPKPKRIYHLKHYLDAILSINDNLHQNKITIDDIKQTLLMSEHLFNTMEDDWSPTTKEYKTDLIQAYKFIIKHYKDE